MNTSPLVVYCKIKNVNEGLVGAKAREAVLAELENIRNALSG